MIIIIAISLSRSQPGYWSLAPSERLVMILALLEVSVMYNFCIHTFMCNSHTLVHIRIKRAY